MEGSWRVAIDKKASRYDLRRQKGVSRDSAEYDELMTQKSRVRERRVC
jgi:hypothetical protein